MPNTNGMCKELQALICVFLRKTAYASCIRKLLALLIVLISSLNAAITTCICSFAAVGVAAAADANSAAAEAACRSPMLPGPAKKKTSRCSLD